MGRQAGKTALQKKKKNRKHRQEQGPSFPEGRVDEGGKKGPTRRAIREGKTRGV